MVNVTDVKSVEKNFSINYDESLFEIFFAQKELLFKYKGIEYFNGKQLSEYIDEKGKLKTIDSLESQEICKNFAWRTTEEIAEGLDALILEDDEHLKEELADGLHFITELLILNGFDSKTFKTGIIAMQESRILDEIEQGVELHAYALTTFLHNLGMAMNKLKQKPWKVSQTMTDKARYEAKLIDAYYKYLDLCFSFGLTFEELFNYYFKKNKVNNFRVDSKY